MTNVIYEACSNYDPWCCTENEKNGDNVDPSSCRICGLSKERHEQHEEGKASRFLELGIAMISQTRVASLSHAVLDVAAERLRQIDDEGWDEEHDDAHPIGSLALAGAAYAHMAYALVGTPPPPYWPFDYEWWKLKIDSRHNLVRAAALIIAEIERGDRATPPPPTLRGC